MSKRAAVNTVSDDQLWVCEKGHVDDHHMDDGGVCEACDGEAQRVITGIEPECCGNTTTSGECHGDCAVPREVEEIEVCFGCNGSGRETNDLCSRCGGKCTPFRSVEHLAREYVERLRVNVGLLVENKQLKRQTGEGK
jgi:DnaJ-class molecular chaperone